MSPLQLESDLPMGRKRRNWGKGEGWGDRGEGVKWRGVDTKRSKEGQKQPETQPGRVKKGIRGDIRKKGILLKRKKQKGKTEEGPHSGGSKGDARQGPKGEGGKSLKPKPEDVSTK